MRKILLIVCLFIGKSIFSQQLWHDKKRTVRYHPEGTDLVIENGDQRFTRALYGTNTAFRVEAGDLPEFAFALGGQRAVSVFGVAVCPRFNRQAMAQNIKIHREILFN